MERNKSRLLQQQLQLQCLLPMPAIRRQALPLPGKSSGLQLQALARQQARQQQSEL